jgi:hypothetical protein
MEKSISVNGRKYKWDGHSLKSRKKTYTFGITAEGELGILINKIW